jgi:hypothetical protein
MARLQGRFAVLGICHAHLDVGPNFFISYGKEQWEEQLPMLSEWQRDLLVRRIEYWQIPSK